MKKSIMISGLIGIVLLIIALILRLLELPNQILFILAGSLSLFLVAHIAYIQVTTSRRNTRQGKAYEWFLFTGMFLLLVYLFLYFYGDLNKWHLFPWAILSTAGLVKILLSASRIKDPNFKNDLLFTSLYITGIILLFLTNPISFQMPDRSFDPPINKPAYTDGNGPVIMIDEAHNNFHTMSGRYYAFANLLRKDGYNIEPLTEPASNKSLSGCRILIIANAQNERNVDNWFNPIYPAFTSNEVETIDGWVKNGGSLFLIADHMPMPGAVSDIGERFGFTMHNNFNSDSMPYQNYFCRADSMFVSPLATTIDGEQLDSIPILVGSAFDYPPDAKPVLIFHENAYFLLPDTAWEFHPGTPRINASGMSQLAYKRHGDGRVVIAGEAAMYTSQCYGGLSFWKGGMSSKNSPDNYKLLLNIIHWLDGLYD